jgi:hypothetical protein
MNYYFGLGLMPTYQKIDLFETKDAFNLNEQYEDDLKALNNIKSQINSLANEMSRLEMRKHSLLKVNWIWQRINLR